eukprot:g1407.t1
MDALYAHRFVVAPALASAAGTAETEKAPAVRMWLGSCTNTCSSVTDIRIQVSVPPSWIEESETLANGFLKLGESTDVFGDLRLSSWTFPVDHFLEQEEEAVREDDEESNTENTTRRVCERIVEGDSTMLERIRTLLFFMTAYFHARGESDAAALLVASEKLTTAEECGGPLLRAIVIQSLKARFDDEEEDDEDKKHCDGSGDAIRATGRSEKSGATRARKRFTTRRGSRERRSRESRELLSRYRTTKAYFSSSPSPLTSPMPRARAGPQIAGSGGINVSGGGGGGLRSEDPPSTPSRGVLFRLPLSREANLQRTYMDRLALGKSAHVYRGTLAASARSMERQGLTAGAECHVRSSLSSSSIEDRVKAALVKVDASRKAEEAIESLSERMQLRRDLDTAKEAIEKLKAWLAEAEAARDVALADAAASKRALASDSGASVATKTRDGALRIAVRCLWRWHSIKRCRLAWARWLSATGEGRGALVRV